MKIYYQLKNFLFFDIETVREYKDYLTMTQHKKASNWERFANRFVKEEGITVAEAYEKKAALYVEYGRIVSIAFGFFDAEMNPRIGAIADEDEEALLKKVSDVFNKHTNRDTILCGHNTKEFDIPYIIKRMIKYKITIPTVFFTYLNAKSWEQNATDTQYDWRIAGNRFTSLDTIAEFLGIESSKEGEITGENLGEYFWRSPEPMDVKLQKINIYCKADVRVLMDFAKHINSVLPNV